MISCKICHYCQQPALYAPLPDNLATSRIKVLRVYFCAPCSAEYVFWADDSTLASVHLYTVVNGKMYRWSTSPSEKLARLWYIKNPGAPGKRANEGVILLKDFQEFSEITPSNLHEKISFMLPFL